MALITNAIKGTLDTLPSSSYKIQYIEAAMREIAENYGITRQGVRDAIKHGEATLMEMEEKLGTARRTEAIRADLARLEELVSEVRVCNTGLFEPDTRIQRATEEMLTIIHRLDTQEELPDGI